MKRILVWGLTVGVVLAASASEARAQMTMGTFKGYLTGHVGVITGGDVTSERLTAGASVAVQEDSGWGAEIDFGHASDATSGRQVLDINTYLVNASWVKPAGLVRPFAIAGAGVLNVNGCGSPCARDARTYDLGLSAGGGAFLVVHDTIAFRADARYFFSSADHPDLARPNNFAFWRMSVGATFMWAIVP